MCHKWINVLRWSNMDITQLSLVSCQSIYYLYQFMSTWIWKKIMSTCVVWSCYNLLLIFVPSSLQKILFTTESSLPIMCTTKFIRIFVVLGKLKERIIFSYKLQHTIIHLFKPNDSFHFKIQIISQHCLKASF